MSRYPLLTLNAAQLAEIEDTMVNDKSEYVRRRARAIFQWLHVYQTNDLEELHQPSIQLDDGTYAFIVDFDPGAPVCYSDVLRDRVEQRTGMCFTPQEFDELLFALGGRWAYNPEDKMLYGRIPLVGDDEFFWYDPLSGRTAD